MKICYLFFVCTSLFLVTFIFSGFIFPYTWSYRITINVETPEGIRSGSAIRSVSALQQPLISPHVSTSVDVIGEAVVVDLGKRGKLFALIDWDSYREVFVAFPFTKGGATTSQGLRYYQNLESESMVALPKARWPKMVSFKDTNDPESVMPVRGVFFDPESKKDLEVNFIEDIFGPGVSIKNITIEITIDQENEKIEKILPWLKEVGGSYLHGGNTSRNAPFGLHGGNFKRD